MNLPYRVLLVDDEPDILEFLGYNLRKEGYMVETARNGREAIEKTIRFEPHLLLLDIMMPEMDGMSTCKSLRALPNFNNTRIIFLSALNEDKIQLDGFNAGADDFISKPIQPGILMGKIRAILKRIPESKHRDLIAIDKSNYIIRCDQKEISLPRKEFELISYLYERKNRICTRKELYLNVWGKELHKTDRSLDVHISNLREKLPLIQIVTIKGIGFKCQLSNTVS
jgi:two-component system alkaline phosphatase synthesis response regulator PhoP